MISTLAPTSFEELELPSGLIRRIPKCEPIFNIWQGNQEIGTYGGKDLLDINDEPAFAEIVILRLLQQDGWDGVWVDTYSRKYRISNNVTKILDPVKESTLDSIYTASGSNSGCFDVFAWRGNEYLFAESKKKSKDQIRLSQLRWLEAALAVEFSETSFLIVEWSISEQ
jgi:hypothetical protein